MGIYREFDEIAKMHINRSNSHLRVQLVKPQAAQAKVESCA